MSILIILGFIVFAVLSVFGAIDIYRQINRIDVLYLQELDRLKEEEDKIERERFQYLAGIKMKSEVSEVSQVPVKLRPDLIGELLAESKVDLYRELDNKK